MRQEAKVVQVNGDTAILEVKRNTACGECGHKCMVGAEDLIVKAKAKNTLNAKVGDIITVEMELTTVLGASMIAYGIPFLLFMTGAFLGYYLLYQFIPLNRDVIALGLGAVLMAAGFFSIKLIDKMGKFEQKYSINMVE